MYFLWFTSRAKNLYNNDFKCSILYGSVNKIDNDLVQIKKMYIIGIYWSKFMYRIKKVIKDCKRWEFFCKKKS